MTAPDVELLLRVPPEGDKVELVARTRDGIETRTYALGVMDRAGLLKAARLLLAGAIGEDGVRFLLACADVGAECPPEDAASETVMATVWQALRDLEQAQLAAAGEAVSS